MKEKLHLSGGHKALFFFWSLLFTASFFVFVLSLSLKTTLLTPQYYKDNLKKVDAYTRIINEGIPSLLLTIHVSDDQLTDSLAKELSTLLIQKVVDPAWLEETTDTFIARTVEFLKDPTKSVALDLTDFNVSLDKLSKSLMLIEELIPGCKEVTTKTSSKTTSTPSSLVPITLDCTKSSENLDELKKDLRGIREGIDAVNLSAIQVGQVVSDANMFIQKIRLFIKEINIYFWVSMVSLMVLIVALFIAKRKDLLDGLQSLSLVGGISSLLALVIGFVVSVMTPKTLDTQDIVLSPAMRSIVNDFLTSVISGFFGYFQTCALVVLGASIILYVVVLLTKSISPKPHTHK